LVKNQPENARDHEQRPILPLNGTPASNPARHREQQDGCSRDSHADQSDSGNRAEGEFANNRQTSEKQLDRNQGEMRRGSFNRSHITAENKKDRAAIPIC
jgi:hypothetical protein